jgi:hypothetical protein
MFLLCLQQKNLIFQNLKGFQRKQLKLQTSPSHKFNKTKICFHTTKSQSSILKHSPNHINDCSADQFSQSCIFLEVNPLFYSLAYLSFLFLTNNNHI